MQRRASGQLEESPTFLNSQLALLVFSVEYKARQTRLHGNIYSKLPFLVFITVLVLVKHVQLQLGSLHTRSHQLATQVRLCVINTCLLASSLGGSAEQYARVIRADSC